MYIFALFVFDSFYVKQENVRKYYFHSETVLFCRMFALLERNGSVIRLHEDLIRFNNNIP